MSQEDYIKAEALAYKIFETVGERYMNDVVEEHGEEIIDRLRELAPMLGGRVRTIGRVKEFELDESTADVVDAVIKEELEGLKRQFVDEVVPRIIEKLRARLAERAPHRRFEPREVEPRERELD
ncbi:MAG: hypothetical protein ACK4SY_07835 [Pyrobaculum sp.]